MIELEKHRKEITSFIINFLIKELSELDCCPYTKYSDSFSHEECTKYMDQLDSDWEHYFSKLERISYHKETDTITFGSVDVFHTSAYGIPSEYTGYELTDIEYPIKMVCSVVYIGSTEMTEELLFMLNTTEEGIAFISAHKAANIVKNVLMKELSSA